MNKVRLNKISNIRSEIETLKDKLQELYEEEQEYYDNMPGSLQYSERGEKSEECQDAMDYVLDTMNKAIDKLDEIL